MRRSFYSFFKTCERFAGVRRNSRVLSGHLATAVAFTENVTGDYILYDNKRFVIADPTYIGAPVGMTMPGMDNKTAKIILLNK